jgi:hypothetical protein
LLSKIINYGQPDCECKHCQNHRANKGSKLTLNHGKYKTAKELADNEINRVSLPGDADYKMVVYPTTPENIRIAEGNSLLVKIGKD